MGGHKSQLSRNVFLRRKKSKNTQNREITITLPYNVDHTCHSLLENLKTIKDFKFFFVDSNVSLIPSFWVPKTDNRKQRTNEEDWNDFVQEKVWFK